MSEVSGFIGTGNDDITATQSWQALAAHQPHVFAMHLREVFAVDPRAAPNSRSTWATCISTIPSTGCCAKRSNC